jgi:hypothetical protein
VLNKASEREQKAAARKAKQHEAFDIRRKEQEACNQELEQALDEQRAKLSDAITAMEFDLQRAEKKIVATLKLDGAESNQCLEERAALVNCLHKTSSPGTSGCNLFVGAMEKCVKKSTIPTQQ